MFELLKNIGEFVYNTVGTLIEFLWSLVNGLISLLRQLPKILDLITSITSLNYIPAIFAGFFSITIIIYILYLILGRDAGD